MPSSRLQIEWRRRRAVFRDLGFWFILTGYLVRLLLMPVTGQHDVMFMPWMTHFINQGHGNLYAYLYDRFGDIVMHRPGVWAPYPYGFYAWTAGWLGLGEGLGWWDLAAWDTTWEVSHPARVVFLLKAAYLPFDLALAYVLYRHGGRRALALWAWAPTAIYTPFIMGQNDIYATALAVAGTYAAARAAGAGRADKTVPTHLTWLPGRWAILCAVSLGLGATFKIYPLLLLPPLVLIADRRWLQRLTLVGLGAAIFGLLALPFVGTPAYVDGVLLNIEGTRLLQPIALLGVPVSPFLVGYLILLFVLAWRDREQTCAEGAGTSHRSRSEHPEMRMDLHQWTAGASSDAPSSDEAGVSDTNVSEDASSSRWKRQADAPWLAALVVLALFFLWTPTPFYWAIWLTPFLIAAATARSEDRLGHPGLLWAWLALEGAFVMIMLAEHRELGISLPVHLFERFNLPNLPTSLAVAYPPLARLLTAAWPLVNAALVTAWLLALWSAFRGLLHPGHRVGAVPRSHTCDPCACPAQQGSLRRRTECDRRANGASPDAPSSTRLGWIKEHPRHDHAPARVPIWAALPALGMFLGLGANLLFGWNLSGRPNWYVWQEQTLSAAGVVQTMPAALVPDEITGVRLRVTGGDPKAVLRACLYEQDLSGEPLACASSSLSRRVEEQALYLMFDQKLTPGGRAVSRSTPLSPASFLYPLSPWWLSLSSSGPGLQRPEILLHLDVPSGHEVTLPYTQTEGRGQVQFADLTVEGTLDVTLLSPFPASAAIDRLIVEGILQDGGLIVALVVTGILVFVMIGLLLSLPAENAPDKWTIGGSP